MALLPWTCGSASREHTTPLDRMSNFSELVDLSNRLATKALGQASAQFSTGDPVDMTWREIDDADPGRMRSAPREWELGARWEDLAAINPRKNDVVTVGGVDYAIVRIVIESTISSWARLTVRPID